MAELRTLRPVTPQRRLGARERLVDQTQVHARPGAGCADLGEAFERQLAAGHHDHRCLAGHPLHQIATGDVVLDRRREEQLAEVEPHDRFVGRKQLEFVHLHQSHATFGESTHQAPRRRDVPVTSASNTLVSRSALIAALPRVRYGLIDRVTVAVPLWIGSTDEQVRDVDPSPPAPRCRGNHTSGETTSDRDVDLLSSLDPSH